MRAVDAERRTTRVSIDVLNETDVEVDELELRRPAPATSWPQMRVHPQAELSRACSSTRTRWSTLHVQWMDVPGPDRRHVASRWTSCARRATTRTPEPGLLGDIVLCPQVARKQARDGGSRAPSEELLLLTTHGILHLLGYDHAEPDEETRDVRAAAPAAADVPRHARRARAPDRRTPAVTVLASRGRCSSPRRRVLARRRRGRALPDVPRPRARSSLDEGRRGAEALVPVVGDPRAYLSVLAFLRVVAEVGRGGARHARRRRAVRAHAGSRVLRRPSR